MKVMWTASTIKAENTDQQPNQQTTLGKQITWLSKQATVQDGFNRTSIPVEASLSTRLNAQGLGQLVFGKIDRALNVAMITTEITKNKTGGLGEVMGSISDQLQQKGNMNVMVVSPFTKHFLEDVGKTVHDTGVGFDYNLPNGHNIPVRLYESKEASGVVNVLLRADEVFQAGPKPETTPFKTLWEWLSQVPNRSKKLGYASAYTIDDKHSTNFLFSAMAARALPLLDGTQPAKGANDHFIKEPGTFDAVMINDWLTGAAAAETKLVYDKLRTGRKAKQQTPAQVFMVHNQFNVPIDKKLASDVLGLQDPFHRSNARVFGTALDDMKGTKTYNPWALAMNLADGVIVNQNYKWEMLNTKLLQDPGPRGGGYKFSPESKFMYNALKRKDEAGLTQDMIHALPPSENAFTSPHLSVNGYTTLELGTSVAEKEKKMAAFKAHNKATLQAELGLKTDPDATIFLYVNRLDMYQKGTYLVLNQMKPLLKKDPKAQFVIYGMGPDVGLTKAFYLDKELQEFQAQGRIKLLNEKVNRPQVLQACAGSDFFLMTSYYEPYGLSQLEAKAFGVIPLALPVGGLRSTLSDPKWNGKNAEGREDGRPKEKVWDYGQTAILLKPFDLVLHRDAVMKMHNAVEALFNPPAPKAGGTGKQAKATKASAEAPTPPDPTTVKALPAEDIGKLNPKAREILKTGDEAMAEAFSRAMAMNQETRTKMRVNNLKYLDENHQWSQIVPKYRAIMEKAVETHQGLAV